MFLTIEAVVRYSNNKLIKNDFMGILVVELLKQLAIAVPSIMLGTQTITAAIHGVFNVENKNWVHAISWVVSVLAGLGFVAFGGLTFGLAPVWNYVLGGVAGLLSGAAANGVYDWPVVANIFDAITRLFEKKDKE